jgi:hypothetical protein
MAKRLPKYLAKKAERYRNYMVNERGAVGFKRSTQEELLNESYKNEAFDRIERASENIAKQHKEDDYENYEDNDDIKAEHGFKGIIKKPTHFIVGERGQERMYIDPVTDYLHIEPNRGTRKRKSDLDFDFSGGFKSFIGDFKF